MYNLFKRGGGVIARITRAHVVASFITVILLLAILQPTAELPVFDTYSGPLQFSGEQAYKELERFVLEYPYRYAGSSASFASADNIADRFRQQGLDVELQDFETYSALQLDVQTDRRGNPLNPGKTVEDIFRPLTGRNVVGVLPGKRRETIVIGAHRDIISTIEGAEDNGSGTVVMLQLAGILSQSQREYTYAFVSFDAEEIALMGSERFASYYKHGEVVLAVSLDMMGWKDADHVGFYPFAAAGNRTELWVYALAQQLTGAEWSSSQTIWQDLWNMSTDMIPTDTHPFARRGIPVLGVVAVSSEYQGSYYDSRPIHTPLDNMSIVSADTLHMTGLFIERFILTVESGHINGGSSSLYVPVRNGIIPVWFVGTAYLLLFTGLVGILGFDLFKNLPIGAHDLRTELPIIAAIILVAAATVGLWFNLFSPVLSSQSIFIVGAMGLVIPAIGLLAIAKYRRRSQPAQAQTRFVLAIGLLALLLIGLVTVGFARTAVLIALPIIMGSFWPLVWLIAFFPVFFSLLSPYMLSFFTWQTGLFFTWAVLLWVFSGVYTLSSSRTKG